MPLSPLQTPSPDALLPLPPLSQVICPMRKGPSGTVVLNRMLQALLNPPAPNKPELARNPSKATAGGGSSGGAAAAGLVAAAAGGEAAKVFRLGDCVIQQQNDYDKEVFNGDQGRVSGSEE